MEHSQKYPWLRRSALKYTIVYVNWVEKVTSVEAHPPKGSYIVSSLIAVNEMHGDDNKTTTEIAMTTKGHPLWRLKGPVT